MISETAYQTETLTTLGNIQEQVETARKAGYEAGYKAGAADTSHLLKFGAIDFEPQAVNHVCESCADEFFGTPDAARNAGWDLGIGCEWCASCGG
jgi:hypothetical protein